MQTVEESGGNRPFDQGGCGRGNFDRGRQHGFRGDESGPRDSFGQPPEEKESGEDETTENNKNNNDENTTEKNNQVTEENHV